MSGSVHAFKSLPEVVPADGRYRPPAPPRERPLIGLIRNTRSHREGGPLPASGLGADIITQIPDRRGQLPAILASFVERRVDAIAISGGDGTVRDVLTCGAGQFGDNWPPIILLPYGKTNALALDLGLPENWPLPDAIAALLAGRTIARQPMAISDAANPAMRIDGFVMGAGAFTNTIDLGQRVHGFGAVNALAVGMTTVWSAAQMVLGRAGNKWRRPVGLTVQAGSGGALPHSKPDDAQGGAGTRFLLFASSLDSLPAGIDPFAHVGGPIGVAAIDRMRPSLMPLVLRLLRGGKDDSAADNGIHIRGTDRFEFTCEEPFILDGEAFPPGSYKVASGPALRFVVP